MRKRRSLFNVFFGRPKAEPKEQTHVQLMSGYVPTWSTYTGNPYDYAVVRTAVDAIARHMGKLQARHIRRQGNEVISVQSPYGRALAFQPNRYMDAFSFNYKTTSLWLVRNNAFIFIRRDPVTMEPEEFYPIPPAAIELLETQAGDLFVRFRFMNGQQLTAPYGSIIHLRRHYFDNDLFGDPADKTMRTMLQLSQAADDGVINAIKQSAHLRGILQFTSMLKPEDMKAQTERFVEDYMTLSNQGGIAATDAKAEYKELKSDPKMVDAKQMAEIKNRVYDYFGINEKIVQSSYDEDQWNAFYESVIEPMAIQLSLAFTHHLFTDRERGHGNEIIFESNRLQYASMRTKLALVTMVDRGAMTPNEWRMVLNLGPIEGGDRPIRRLDTAVIDEDAMNDDDEEKEVEPDDSEDTAPDDDEEGS